MEFEQWFSSESACEQYLFGIRWSNGFRCPHCGHEKYWQTQEKRYKCQSCSYRVSVIAGTALENTRKPLQLWLRAMWYVTNQKSGASAIGLQRALGFKRYETMWLWLHKLRNAIVRPGRDNLSGTVEVDEIYIGGERPGKRGRGAAGKSLVVIIVEDKAEQGFGRIRLKRVKDASADSLIPAITLHVDLGSTVRTDGWRSYGSLTEKGYSHIV